MRLLFGDCVMDVERRELRRAGDVVRVEPQVFDLILHLIENRDHVVSKEALLAAVWRKRVISDSALSTRVNAARQAIGDSGERQQFIQTISRRGFRFIGQVKDAGPQRIDAPVTVVDRAEGPSIAVLAFANLNGDRDQDYFADGMAEDLITGLSHIRWLMVIARNSSFSYRGRSVETRQIGRELNVRYLLEGSVRRAGDLVRINVQLVEADSGTQLWAGKFDGTFENIFELQDEIVASVIGALEPSVRRAEIERARRKRPDDLDAYDLYLRALSHLYKWTAEGRTAALELAGKALAIDPNYAQAHGVAASCYIRRVWTESDFSTDLANALAHARAIMSIGTDDASTLAYAASSYARATQDYETAIQMIEHALAHNPSSASAQSVGAMVNVWAGHYETAVSLAERSLRFSPFDPFRHLAFAALSRARLFQGDPEAALVAARRAVQATPGHLPSHGYVVICLTRMGRLQERDATVERMLASFPGVSLRHFLVHQTFAPFKDDLAAAGLPV